MTLKKLTVLAILCLTVGAAAMAADPANNKSPAASDKSSATAPSEPRQAKVVSVTGRAQKLATAQGQDKWQDLRAGDMLDERTIIRTGLRSRVVLKFQDRAEVVIEDATKVGISEFLQRGKQVQTQLGLKYGSIRVDVPKENGPTDFSVSTPVATLSIRGTAGGINFAVDAGLNLQSFRGFWNVASDRHHRTVGAEQNTTGTLIPHLELVQQSQSTFPGDFFGGTDSSERQFLQDNGTGRGVIVINNNPQTNDQTTPSGNSNSGGSDNIEVPGGDIDIGGECGPSARPSAAAKPKK